MDKKLLLGALIGAGISMLNKKARQQPQAPSGAPGGGKIPPPDFSRVPPPNPEQAGPDSTSLDDILSRAGKSGGATPGGSRNGSPGDISGGGIPAGAGGAGMLIEMARRVFEQMQQQGGTAGKDGGAPAGASLDDILGQIFGRAGGKFSPQGPGGPGGNTGGWSNPRERIFGFADSGAGAHGEEQADALLRAMVAAAQADGRIDEKEQRNITGALEGKLDSADLEELRQLLTQPVDMDQVIARVNDPATALNLYLVSAMTINEDNPREKAYMDRLAEKLGISEEAVRTIERQLPQMPRAA
ncbi:tellurite resistance TerB family protein [Microbulbifer halophilus]|uniref:Tellurite resistance TerB family protein n=1 Tax=Microbulbifer halophilus TaxID=453963 RepID=A0ABW5EH78_9GAMM|nr:DUF533 domain-containing protein [Microbulbifer halophilus]MCW8127865.1 DUF533 domain-containing protein [Microbulbifer halophilus]